MPQFENPGYPEQPPSYNEAYEEGASKGSEAGPPPSQPTPQTPAAPYNDPWAGSQQTHVPMSPYGDPYMYVGAQPYINQQQVIVCQPDRSQLVVAQEHTPDLVVPAILVCFFCCWPIGLCAIFSATRANDHSRMGNVDEAKRMVTTTMGLIAAGVIFGIIIIVFTILRFTVMMDNSSI